DLCANEAAFYIGVDLARGALRYCAPLYSPGATFIFARCKKTDQIQQLVCSANEAVARRLRDTEVFQKISLLFRRQLSYLHLHFAAHIDQLETVLSRIILYIRRSGLSEISLFLIEENHHRLLREKAETGKHLPIFRRQFQRAKRQLRFQHLLA